jgi:TPP-dependent indolepyruvate ferredoxin oxidoreductase alpha subunit
MDVLADARTSWSSTASASRTAPAKRPRRRRWLHRSNYALRGAVTFKGPVGVNVAADALANLASGGVMGGALVIVGEDYGEGSSIMQRGATFRDEVADLAARSAAEPAGDRRRRQGRLRALQASRRR